VRVAIYAPGAPLEGDVVIVPPGSGAPAPPAALDQLRAFARAGGRLLALGEGVALLCAAELLPGSVTRVPARAATHIRVEGRATAFTWAIPAGRILALGTLALEHAYVAPGPELAALASSGRVVLRYCDAAGGLDVASSRAASVAGVSDPTGRVLGIIGGVSRGLDCALGRQIEACLARFAEGASPVPRALPMLDKASRRG
jgi:phosphoribosylformylglycinamidine (FGAM) synthase-like amidotransferase family enzyme